MVNLIKILPVRRPLISHNTLCEHVTEEELDIVA